jgi:hypothetical protein
MRLSLAEAYPPIPVCQIRHDLLILYELSTIPQRPKTTEITQAAKTVVPVAIEKGRKENLKDAYSGEMTRGSIKRMKKAIDALISIADWKMVKHPTKDFNIRFKLNFITLTLPAPQGTISDKTIASKALKPFIEALKDKHEGVSYIWKAETQENGNIHYHITTDKFIPYNWIKQCWNQKLEKFGYIDKFEEKHGHRHPNSTDIHATHNIKDFKRYLVKYMTKKDDTRRKIEGKTWDCSRNLKDHKRAEVEIDYELQMSLQSYIEANDTQVKQTDHCTLIFIRRHEWKKWLPPRVNLAFENWCQCVRQSGKEPVAT